MALPQDLKDHIEQTRRDEAEYEIVESAVESISRLLSGSISEKNVADHLFKAVSRDHRTLQQLFLKHIVKFIHLYGDQQYFDLRNEASVKICKNLSEYMADKDHFPYI